MRPPVSLLWVVAWLTLAVGPACAADQPGVVALPPFMVEELAKGPPWRYAMTRDFEVLSRCDDASTRRITESYYRLHRLLALVLPEKLQVRFAVPKKLICYDEDMHPAASQEIINQIMSRGNAAPVPTPEEMGGFGGRGFRGGVSPPTPRYSFLPNMRLWDKDAMAVFSIMRSGSYDDEHMVLTADYASYLARSRAPSLPVWYLAAFLSVYPKIKYARDSLTLESAEWISPAETRVLKSDPKKARPLLPMAAFFRVELAANGQSKEENQRVWTSQAELFLRWGLSRPTAAEREGFFRLVERCSTEVPTDKTVRDCLGLDLGALGDQLTAYLPAAVRKDLTLRPDAPIKPPPVAPRNATDSEIARIKGDWERLEIAYVRQRYPELAGKYVEQARRTLQRAYDRNDRDPRLLAVLGLCECDAGNDAGARDYLESAARLGAVRPRAWLELARLRFAERLAAPAVDGKLSAGQAAEVMSPLFTARSQEPPLPEVYDLIADVWLHCVVTPNRSHLGVLSEGMTLFPRRISLLQRVAALSLQSGFPEDAAALIDLGLRLATEDADRARFAELQSRLPATATAR